MNAKDGFKKAVKERTLSVRDAVTLHGDSWRFYANKVYHRSSDLVTSDSMDKMSMTLMEKGLSRRVEPCWDADDREPVHVEHVFPPIPERCWDYRAYRDPDPGNPVGYGGTPFFAINDLIEQESER